jgi:hypothetical protein
MINYLSGKRRKPRKSGTSRNSRIGIGFYEGLVAFGLFIGCLSTIASCSRKYFSRTSINQDIGVVVSEAPVDTSSLSVEADSITYKDSIEQKVLDSTDEEVKEIEEVQTTGIKEVDHGLLKKLRKAKRLVKNLNKFYAINAEDLAEPKTLYITTFRGGYSGASKSHLDPDKEYFCALRVNYAQRPKEFWFDPNEQKIVVLVNPKTGKYLEVPLRDFGPGPNVTRKAGNQIIDVSTRVAKELYGINQSGRIDKREVIVYWKNPELGKPLEVALSNKDVYWSIE